MVVYEWEKMWYKYQSKIAFVGKKVFGTISYICSS